VQLDGQPVGSVTSGTWSPTLDKAIGMAYLPSAAARTGQPIAIDVRGRLVEAAVVGLPFYERRR
jgi:aminomethyltransferase